MTNRRLRFYFKVLFFTFFFFLACGFETSFWPHIFSMVPSPQIWLLVIFFITLKWRPLFAIFYIYFLGFCVTRFSQMPLKMIWCTLLVTFSLLLLLKNRVQVHGVMSFVLYCLIGSTVFQISYVVFSEFLERIPTSVSFIERLLQILMNFIFSYVFYSPLQWLDSLLKERDDWAQSAEQRRFES